LVIDLDEAYNGPVIEELGRRGGRMQEMGPAGEGRMRLEYVIPSRGSSAIGRSFLPTRAAPAFSTTTSPTTAPTRNVQGP